MLKSSVIVLLLLGLAVWPVIFGRPDPSLITFGSLGPIWLLAFGLIIFALAWLPLTAAPTYRFLQQISQPSPLARVVGSIAVGVTTTVFLYLTAAFEHRQFFPYIHDEFSYLIQAHQLARNRLWMPGHPLSAFFDSFQLFTQPVYASAYFPATAILYVPGIWLNLPPYVTSLILSGTVAGLFYWITTQVLDGVAGWLAVLMLLSDGLFRQISILTLAQIPLLLYGLLAIVAWLRWRVNHRAEWAIGLGFFLSLAAATRPVDALSFAIPIGIAVLIDCVKRRSPAAIAGVMFGAVPLLVLQLLLNHGITGQGLRTPFNLYADREYPGSSYGFHSFNPLTRPESDLPQVQALYSVYRPLIAAHRPGNIMSDLLNVRLKFVASQTFPAPFPILIILLPISLVGLFCLAREQRVQLQVLLAILPLFVLLYCPYVFFNPNYVLAIAPMLILGILLGAKTLSDAWPSSRHFTTVGLTLLIAGLSIASLPNWSTWKEDVFSADLLASVNQQLANLPPRPAVVLFTYDPERNINEEPVYNAESAYPDQALTIRAHDRGPLNREIFLYYARQNPQRFFYRFDERSRTISPLGTAEELANHP